MDQFAKNTHLGSEAETCTHVRLTRGPVACSCPMWRLKLTSTYFIIIVMGKKERKKNLWARNVVGGGSSNAVEMHSQFIVFSFFASFFFFCLESPRHPRICPASSASHWDYFLCDEGCSISCLSVECEVIYQNKRIRASLRQWFCRIYSLFINLKRWRIFWG